MEIHITLSLKTNVTSQGRSCRIEADLSSCRPTIHIHPPFVLFAFACLSVSSWTRICSSNFWHWSKCSYGKRLAKTTWCWGKTSLKSQCLVTHPVCWNSHFSACRSVVFFGTKRDVGATWVFAFNFLMWFDVRMKLLKNCLYKSWCNPIVVGRTIGSMKNVSKFWGIQGGPILADMD